MLNRKFTLLCLAIILLTVSSMPSANAAEQQKKIAILPFSFHNLPEDVGDIDVGAEIAKLLSAKLAKMPGWTAIDQSKVWTLIQRDDTANLSGTELGKLLKADAIITGTVQTFQYEPSSDKAAIVAGTAASAASSAAYSASSFVPFAGNLAGIFNYMPTPSGSERGHAKVVIDAKLTDVYSGNVISVLSGTATSRHSANDLWGGGSPNSDFLSESFATCIAGQATLSAVDKICKQLSEVAPQVAALAVYRTQGTVTDVDNNLICLSVGKTNGFKIGDKFIVERQSQSDDTNIHVGNIFITNIGEQCSLAKLIDGSTPIAGDSIRNQPNQ